MNLAVAGRCGQRHGIEIIDDDALAPGAGIGAGAVGFEAGADNLAQLFEGCVGAAVGRVAKFFELHGQGAAALHRHRQMKLGADIISTALNVRSHSITGFCQGVAG